MKYISVHLQRKSNFLKSSTFLNFRWPKRNVQILLLVSDHKRGNNVWGFPSVCSHKSVTCTQEISFPEVHRTQIRMRCPVFPFVCASQMLPSISHVVLDNLWIVITFSSFWRFWWYITGSGGGDSSVVRAPDSWLKGRGFESLQERRDNFILQGRLSVLTLLSVSVPPPCYCSSM